MRLCIAQIECYNERSTVTGYSICMLFLRYTSTGCGNCPFMAFSKAPYVMLSPWEPNSAAACWSDDDTVSMVKDSDPPAVPPPRTFQSAEKTTGDDPSVRAGEQKFGSEAFFLAIGEAPRGISNCSFRVGCVLI